MCVCFASRREHAALLLKATRCKPQFCFPLFPVIKVIVSWAPAACLSWENVTAFDSSNNDEGFSLEWTTKLDHLGIQAFYCHCRRECKTFLLVVTRDYHEVFQFFYSEQDSWMSHTKNTQSSIFIIFLTTLPLSQSFPKRNKTMPPLCFCVDVSYSDPRACCDILFWVHGTRFKHMVMFWDWHFFPCLPGNKQTTAGNRRGKFRSY